VAKKTEVKNEMITSSKVALIDIKKDAEVKTDGATKNDGLAAFTLPQDSFEKKDLKDCKKGSDDAFLKVKIISVAKNAIMKY
jgi:hypothetical protein